MQAAAKTIALPCPASKTRHGFVLGKSLGRSAQKRVLPLNQALWRDDQNGSSSSSGTDDRGVVESLAGGFATFLACGALLAPLSVGGPLGVPSAEAFTLTNEEKRTVNLFKKNTAAVVNVTNLGMRPDAFTLDILEIPQGAGSGIVWDKEGLVVTNFHVIRQASEVQVTLSSGSQYMAKVVGIDSEKDVAVLKIDDNNPGELNPVAVGSSGDLVVGQKVFAIGNPFGLDHTLTTGVISGIGREISSGTGDRALQDVIQTDAAINPGNSGGPLLNSNGELIGVNTAIYSPTGASNGVGFAIPVDIVKSSVDQIVKFGRVIRPFIGISFAQDRSIEELGVQGILVLRTQDGSPAQKAGIRGTSRDEYGRLLLGDVVIGLNGSKVKNATDLFRALDKCRVGDVVDVEVLREKSPEHLKVRLEANN
ncbi:hypothetical protein BSKO_12517 [Bryopsis sp. KO-2023]|nr:hypothetical protein BSKO_12517 [Bryopsis sp. KO-2023]